MGCADQHSPTLYCRFAARDGLHQGIAERGGFDRAGQHRTGRGIGGGLVQIIVPRPATNNVNAANRDRP